MWWVGFNRIFDNSFLENKIFDLRFFENNVSLRKWQKTRKCNLNQHDGYYSRKCGGLYRHLRKVVAFLPDFYSRKWMVRGNKLEPKIRQENTSKSAFSRKSNIKKTRRKWKKMTTFLSPRRPHFLEEIRTGIYVYIYNIIIIYYYITMCVDILNSSMKTQNQHSCLKTRPYWTMLTLGTPLRRSWWSWSSSGTNRWWLREIASPGCRDMTQSWQVTRWSMGDLQDPKMEVLYNYCTI